MSGLASSDSIASLYPEGKEVRLKSDPSKTGSCTGRIRERGGVWMVQVRFGQSEVTWYAEFDLDFSEAPPPEDAEAIRTGRFGRAADLRRKLTQTLTPSQMAARQTPLLQIPLMIFFRLPKRTRWYNLSDDGFLKALLRLCERRLRLSLLLRRMKKDRGTILRSPIRPLSV